MREGVRCSASASSQTMGAADSQAWKVKWYGVSFAFDEQQRLSKSACLAKRINCPPAPAAPAASALADWGALESKSCRYLSPL